MSSMTFLKSIEERGWMVETADKGGCIAKCKTPGCSMRIRIKEGGVIPYREVGPKHSLDQPIHSFDDVRNVLRDRRENLGLIISEVEEVAGIAGDHIAKFECDGYQKHARIPNVQTFLYWANALGYEVVLRPSVLPAVTCRRISETREQWPTRRKRTQRLRRREGEPDREGTR